MNYVSPAIGVAAAAVVRSWRRLYTTCSRIATMTLQHRQGRLFDAGKYQAERSYEPGVWDKAPDIVWHGSRSMVMPEEQGYSSSSNGGGFHTGTKASSEDRIMSSRGNSNDATLHPLRISGQFALPPDKADDDDIDWAMNTDSYKAALLRYDVYGKDLGDRAVHHPNAWDDDAANYSIAAQDEVETYGRNVPYVNNAEDAGSVSIRAPRHNLHTWDEDVESDPNAPTWAKAHVAYGYNLSHPMSTRGTEYPKHPDWNVPDTLPGMERHAPAHDPVRYEQHEAQVQYAKNTKPRLRRP